MVLQLPDRASHTHHSPLLEMGHRQSLRAARLLGWTEERLHRFLLPRRVTEVTVACPADGSVVRAIRVQHSTDCGPSKGGLRMATSVDRPEVEALALLMSLKTAAAGLPLGGGKGGIVADPAALDGDQRAELMTRVTEALAPVIGPDTDVLGPDMGTGEAEMAAAHHAWQAATGGQGTVATGKPLDDGGLTIRDGATARGLAIVFDELSTRLELGSSLRFAVHGFGSVGRGIARRLTDRGHVLVAAADSGGAALDPDGLDVDELIDRKRAEGSVADGDRAADEVLTADCDLLIPAALGGVIDQCMAEEVGAAVVLEGANGPCTWAGGEVLRGRDIIVVPDILANSGGVSASFEEMTEPADRDDDATIEKRFEERLRDACERVWEAAVTANVDLRTAATMVALRAQC